MTIIRNRIYYSVKPFVPQFIRTSVRRRFVLHLRRKVSATWPIVPGSEKSPAGWGGWPGGKQFAFVLTHDVETSLGLRRCPELFDLERELGFRSSYNFVPEGEYEVSKQLRGDLKSAGFEVGVHDLKHDGRLYRSRREFSSRAARINHYLNDWQADGFRSAFMLNELDWLHELNIRYDASTFDTDPFEPQPQGQQTIFPFWVSRPPLRRSELRGFASTSTCETLYPTSPSSSSGYMELPYTLPQDSTLFLLLQETKPDIWIKKLEWLAENGGMALVITHPDYMNFNGSRRARMEYSVNLYRQFLEHVRDKYAGAYWHALPKEVAAYARQTLTVDQPTTPKNGAVTLRGDGEWPTAANNWRIRGKRGAVVLFSYYPSDARPRRAAEALAEAGMSLDLICLRKDESEPLRETSKGVRIIRIPIKRERGGKWNYVRQYSLFILTAFVHLALRSLRRRYHFVHVHNMPDVLVFSAIVPKMLGARVLLDLHDPVPELMQTIFDLPGQSFTIRLLRTLEKWSTRFADHVVTVNEACKRIYSRRSCPADKITVVVNSPDENIFQFRDPSRNGNGRKEFTVLYHGSLLARNGLDVAVDALSKVRRSIPEARLVICGESTPFFAETMDLAKKQGLADSIDYLGVKNRAGIIDAIANCDVGVIPNRRSVFADLNTPTRIFECLALGKPVIAPRTRGICDYFGEDDLVFFDVGNAEDLARQLESVYFDPAKATGIVERGQNIYRSHAWSHQRAKLLSVVGSLV